MFDAVLDIVLAEKVYSITGALIVFLIVLSLLSREFYKGVKLILLIAVPLWAIAVGYKYNTGRSVFSLLNTDNGSETVKKKDVGAFQKYQSTDSLERIKRGD